MSSLWPSQRTGRCHLIRITRPGSAVGLAVTFRPGTDTAKATARLDRRLAAVDQNFFTQAPTKPTDLVNFGRIQDLPLILGGLLVLGGLPVLGGLLAVMALITVAHLLATSIRRRRPSRRRGRRGPASVLREE